LPGSGNTTNYVALMGAGIQSLSTNLPCTGDDSDLHNWNVGSNAVYAQALVGDAVALEIGVLFQRLATLPANQSFNILNGWYGNITDAITLSLFQFSTPATLPNAVGGSAYSVQLNANNPGNTGFTFSTPYGSLPSWLSFQNLVQYNSSTQIGTLMANAVPIGAIGQTFTFTVRATDNATGLRTERLFSLTVVSSSTSTTTTYTSNVNVLNFQSGYQSGTNVSQQFTVSSSNVVSEQCYATISGNPSWLSCVPTTVQTLTNVSAVVFTVTAINLSTLPVGVLNTTINIYVAGVIVMTIPVYYTITSATPPTGGSTNQSLFVPSVASLSFALTQSSATAATQNFNIAYDGTTNQTCTLSITSTGATGSLSTSSIAFGPSGVVTQTVTVSYTAGGSTGVYANTITLSFTGGGSITIPVSVSVAAASVSAPGPTPSPISFTPGDLSFPINPGSASFTAYAMANCAIFGQNTTFALSYPASATWLSGPSSVSFTANNLWVNVPFTINAGGLGLASTSIPGSGLYVANVTVTLNGNLVYTYQIAVYVKRFSKPGMYNSSTNLWQIDNTASYSINKAFSFYFPYSGFGGSPVVGDWNGDGRAKPGIVYLSKNGGPLLWYLDYNGDYLWSGPPNDRLYSFGQSGDIPVVGDWNGDGRTKIGVFRSGTWLLDYNGDGVWTPGIDLQFNFGSAGMIPFAGKWGNTLGIIVPNQSISLPGVYQGGTTFVLSSVLATPSASQYVSFPYQTANYNDPIIGDWYGNGTDTVGVFANTEVLYGSGVLYPGGWICDYNYNHKLDGPYTNPNSGQTPNGDLYFSYPAGIGAIPAANIIPVPGRW
jgi:hypothetical protein